MLPRQADPPLHLIYTPIQTGVEDIAAGFTAGATNYLTKPFKLADIRVWVHSWLWRTCLEPPSEA
jgi:DNA-binding response OmpR family regulator